MLLNEYLIFVKVFYLVEQERKFCDYETIHNILIITSRVYEKVFISIGNETKILII